MSKELARLFAKRFIQRADTKAIQFDKVAGQFKPGDWFPDSKIDASKRPNSPHLPHGFNMAHLLAHLNGERTYGHYLLDDDSNAKVFCFDVDLEKKGTYVTLPDWDSAPKFTDVDEEDAWFKANSLTEVVDGGSVTLRDLWMDRRREAAPARKWLKYQMKTVAHMLASKVVELEIPCAVSYSGSKGVHVYGMTGTLPAKEVREAAMLVLDMVDEFKPVRGKHFFHHKNDDPIHGFQNLSIEVFPKQDTLDDKNLGNLLRLPLGVNHKNPKDPTFFLDMTTPLGAFSPHKDPIKLLEEGNPFV